MIRNRPPNENAKNHGPLSPYQIPSIQGRYISDSNRPPNEKMENHEPLSNALYISPFQASYVACRPRCFGPRAPFVLPIRIRLSGGKFC